MRVGHEAMGSRYDLGGRQVGMPGPGIVRPALPLEDHHLSWAAPRAKAGRISWPEEDD